MDITGVRREGPAETEAYPSKEVEGKTITVYEVWHFNYSFDRFYFLNDEF